MLVRCWNGIREYLSRRPAAFFLAFVTALALALSQAYTLSPQPFDQRDINAIKYSFCSGQDKDSESCRQLIEIVLKDPTKEQKVRISNIVKGSQ